MSTQGSFSQFDSSIKILIATDNHLGYKEDLKDKNERYQDSFNAFEEVLQLAIEHKVDFVLLGGDLFHEKHPTQRCLFNCIEIMQKYVFGDYFQGIQMERTSANYEPNFSNTHFNIGLPIFVINGNHDNHSSDDSLEQISILDIMHKSQYLNYFGKVTNQNDIVVKPLIFFKGRTKLAIYGIGYVEDYQFNKLLKLGRVTLEGIESTNYNILVIHQNRYKGTHYAGQSNFLDPNQFKDFKVNLIVWGHEHKPYYTFETFDNNLKVFQAGSTVATSLIEDECKEKQAGLLTITTGAVEFQSLKLVRSYRPMHIRQIELEEMVQQCKDKSLSKEEMAEKLLNELVDQELKKHYSQDPYKERKPLLRVKVEHTGYDSVRLKRLETRFQDRVANPDKIFAFWKRKTQIEKNIQQQQVQIEKMNENFYSKLQSKDGFNNQNAQVIDCSNKFKQQISTSQYKVLKPSTFEAALDSITNSKEQKMSNPLDQIVSTVYNSLARDFLQPKVKEVVDIVSSQTELQDQLAKDITQLLDFNYDSISGRVYKESAYTQHGRELNVFMQGFRDEFGTALKKVDVHLEAQNQLRQPNLEGFMQQEVPEKKLDKSDKEAKGVAKIETKAEEESDDAFLNWISQNPAAAQEHSSSVRIIEEEEEIPKQKKEPKKRKQTKKETKRISSKSKTNHTFL